VCFVIVPNLLTTECRFATLADSVRARFLDSVRARLEKPSAQLPGQARNLGSIVGIAGIFARHDHRGSAPVASTLQATLFSDHLLATLLARQTRTRSWRDLGSGKFYGHLIHKSGLFVARQHRKAQCTDRALDRDL